MQILSFPKTVAKRLLMQAASALGPHNRTAHAPLLWVLMYHRIIPEAQAVNEGEEPGMYVRPETFHQHLGWLRECFEIVRLGDWCASAATGKPLPPKACAITFDDGWRDNLEYALPALIAHEVPATVFVVSDLVGSSQPFWPNRLSRLITERLEFLLEDASCAWLRELALAIPEGLAGAQGSAESRAALIALCKQHPDGLLLPRLAAAEASSGLSMQESRSMLSWDELQQMVQTGLVDVGSHTCRHVRLRRDVPEDLVRHEIIQSQRAIEARLQCQPDLFCYPNGDYTDTATALVASTYRGAVTTEAGINNRQTPLSQLKRIGMHEHISRDRTAFRARLSGWI